jgi:hypothetical protein
MTPRLCVWRTTAWPNPYEAPRCQETNEPLKRRFIFSSAYQGLVQAVRGVVC